MHKFLDILGKVACWYLALIFIGILFCAGCIWAPKQEITDVYEITEENLEDEANLIPEDSTFSIRFLDVGQGDAALVECDGHYMLIDGGNKKFSSKIYSVLKEAGIDHLDIVVGTHADEDHIGGLSGALNYATADLTLCSVTEHDTEAFSDFSKYAALNGGGISVPEIGDIYSLGSSNVLILGVNGGSKSNDTSIILKIQYGETSFLFTGDAESEAEQAVIDSGKDLSADVLKVGHHGSSDSTSDAFLREVMPTYAIISVGSENTYFHPTSKVLEKLKNANAEIFRTDLNGEITVTSDGKAVSIVTEKTASSSGNIASGGDTSSGTASSVSGTDYIANTNTGKFHYPSCGSVKKMKESNKLYFHGTRDELIAKGYVPCGNCHP